MWNIIAVTISMPSDENFALETLSGSIVVEAIALP
jgi:hypothetical protein